MNTIEQNLQRIADALETLAALKDDVPFHPSPAVAPPIAPPIAPAVAPAVAPAFDAAAVFAQMPSQLPVEQITQPAPVEPPSAPVIPFPQAGIPASTLPFDTVDGLRVYIIESFQTLEAKAPGTGVRVKDVMTSLGYQRVDDVPAAQYETLYRGVEQVLRS